MPPVNGRSRGRTRSAGPGDRSQRLALVVESPLTVTLLAEDSAQILEGHGVLGIDRQSRMGLNWAPHNSTVILDFSFSANFSEP